MPIAVPASVAAKATPRPTPSEMRAPWRHAREQVPAEQVGAERAVEARRQRALVRQDQAGIARPAQDRRGKGHDRDDREDDDANVKLGDPARRDHCRTLGSIAAQSRSTARFTATNTKAKNKVTPWITG